MKQKFAILSCVKTPEEIPIKLNIIKKMPILDWYIHKFNPYKSEKIKFLEAEGYNIKLPITESELISDKEKAWDIINRTIESLQDYNVSIAMLPKKIEIIQNIENELGYIKVATGKTLMPFFIMESIIKILKSVRKELKFANIVILGESEQTEAFIHSIYPEVNFLTVMVNDESKEKYEELAEEIFYDTGLNMRVDKASKNNLTSADIIIDTSYEKENFDFCFKRGAVYFDCSCNKKKTEELILKRDDMLIIDDLKLSCDRMDMSLPLCYFELILFITSREYRYIKSKGYDKYSGGMLKKQLNKMEIKPVAYIQLGKTISSINFKRFLKRAGVRD